MKFYSPSAIPLFFLAVPFIGLPYVPFLCEEKVKVGVGNATAEVCVKKDVKTGEFSTQIPPGANAQTVVVGDCRFTIPANPSNQPVPFQGKWTDPLVVQVPSTWTLVASMVTTPLGSAPAIVTPGPVPSEAVILPAPPPSFVMFAPSAFYTAEPGMQLLVFDYPPGLEAPGPSEAVATFSIPPGPGGLVVLKGISAGKVTLTHPIGGPSIEVYPPQDPLGVTDFSLVTSQAHTMLADAVDGTDCPVAVVGPSPDMDLLASNWIIGGITTIGATGYAPGTPVFFLVTLSDQFPGVIPLPLTPGGPGCKLRVNPLPLLNTFGPFPANGAGSSSFAFLVPFDPLLIDLSLSLQAVGIELGVAFVTTHHLKGRMESP